MASHSFTKFVRRSWSALHAVWCLLGVTLILLLSLEVVLQTMYATKTWLRGNEPPVDSRVTADGYADTSWVPAYYRELHALSMHWDPYVYWRRNAFDGEYIHVNPQGLRRTIQKQLDDETEPATVWLFGGSTMWGTGARDEQTIPSHLASLLAERGHQVRIVNLGESGYVSTQEYLTFLLRLREHEPPDVAIFYDGVNDTYAAYQNGVAGWPQNETHRREEFNLLQEPEKVLPFAANWLLTTNSVGISRFARSIRRRFTGKNQPSWLPPQLPEEGLQGLAAEVVEVYARNRRLIQLLAEEHGSQVLAYWQPVLFTKQRMSPHERKMAEKFEYLQPLHAAVDEAFRAWNSDQESGAMSDLSTIFDDTEEPCFLDYCHTTEAANRILAEAMLADVEAALATK